MSDHAPPRITAAQWAELRGAAQTFRNAECGGAAGESAAAARELAVTLADILGMACTSGGHGHPTDLRAGSGPLPPDREPGPARHAGSLTHL